MSDNCPWLANGAQEDTNIDSERVLFDSTSPCTNPGQAPTSSDSAACVEYFRTHYKGDACDVDSVSRASLYDAPTDAPGVCQVVQLTPLGGYTMGGTTICPQHVNTAMRWSSREGNLRGFEAPATDTTEPSFCWCDVANSVTANDCRLATGPYKCVTAQDNKFPAPDGAGIGGANWRRITRYSAPATNILFPKATTTHQYINDYSFIFPPSSLFGYDTSLEVSATWAWPRDNATFGEPTLSPGYAGILWTHVFPSDWTRAPNQPFLTVDAQSAPTVNLPNHYVSLTTRSEGWSIVEVPVSGPNLTKWWLWGEQTNTVALAPIVKVVSNGGTSTLLVQRASDGVTVQNYRLTSAALSVLAPVASGSRQLVLGDDVIGRSTLFGGLPPALVLAPNSMSIRGALTTNGWFGAPPIRWTV
ncbi:hypothetical protein BH09MYX1_BH09MYX1_66040 [soil metagenome]